MLMPEADELALPILYLQRHTFELMVKDLLLSALDERKLVHTFDDIFGTISGAGPALDSDFDLAHGSHKFGKLLPRLEDNREALRKEPLPSVFQQLRDLFVGTDGDEPDRLRYDTQRKNKIVHRSFEPPWEGKPTYAPCHKVAELMRELIDNRRDALEKFINNEDRPETEIGRFYFDEFENQSGLDEAVGQRLLPLEADTRGGKMHWTVVPKERFRVTGHPSLAQYSPHISDGFEAVSDGRNFALVQVGDMIRTNAGSTPAFFFAAIRQNGTLTEGVWLERGDTNLVHAVRSQVKQ